MCMRNFMERYFRAVLLKRRYFGRNNLSLATASGQPKRVRYYDTGQTKQASLGGESTRGRGLSKTAIRKGDGAKESKVTSRQVGEEAGRATGDLQLQSAETRLRRTVACPVWGAFTGVTAVALQRPTGSYGERPLNQMNVQAVPFFFSSPIDLFFINTNLCYL